MRRGRAAEVGGKMYKMRAGGVRVVTWGGGGGCKSVDRQYVIRTNDNQSGISFLK